MAVRAFRILALTAALLPIVMTIGAPDLEGLSRAVSKLFRESQPAAPLPVLSVGLRPHEASVLPISKPGLALALQDVPALALRAEPIEFQSLGTETPLMVEPTVTPHQKRGPLISSLYASFITLQALDAHSTLRALDRGAREGNPLIEPFTHNTAALIALKAGTAAGVLYMTDRVHRHNRVAGIVIMAAANSAYAMIVARNYRIASIQR